MAFPVATWNMMRKTMLVQRMLCRAQAKLTTTTWLAHTLHQTLQTQSRLGLEMGRPAVQMISSLMVKMSSCAKQIQPQRQMLAMQPWLLTSILCLPTAEMRPATRLHIRARARGPTMRKRRQLPQTMKMMLHFRLCHMHQSRHLNMQLTTFLVPLRLPQGKLQLQVRSHCSRQMQMPQATGSQRTSRVRRSVPGRQLQRSSQQQPNARRRPKSGRRARCAPLTFLLHIARTQWL